MKIAYVGYDLSCQKANYYFNQTGCEVVYFLKEKMQDFNYPAFSDLDILIDHVTVPGNLKLRSSAHKQALKIVKEQYLELKQSLSPWAVKESTSNTVAAAKIVDLNLLQDIQYDGKQKKVFIEIEKKGVETFDYVFIEAHPLVAQALFEKKIKVFRSPLEVQYIWSSISFAVDYVKPIEPLQQRRTFFVVQDPLRKSLIDNWFLCDFQKDNMLHIWGYMPFRQIANPQFKKFYIDRMKTFIVDKFKFIHLKDFLNAQLSSVGTSDESVSMAFKQTLSVPNFMFWSESQVNNFFEQKFTKKIKVSKLSTEGAQP